MKKIINEKCTHIGYVLFGIVFAFGLFTVLPSTNSFSLDFGTETAFAQFYDYGSDYWSGGDVGAGCCDSYSFDYGSYSPYSGSYSNTYDYGSDYWSGGDVGAGCCDSYSYGYSGVDATNYDYVSYDYGSDYWSGGDVGAGCCDSYSYGSSDPFVSTPSAPIDYDYGSDYWSGGDVGAGCCDSYSYASQDSLYPDPYVPPYEPQQVVYQEGNDIPFVGGGTGEYVPYVYAPGGVGGGGYAPYSYGGYSYTSVPYGNVVYQTTSYNNTSNEPRPTCTLDITPNSIDEDESATIRWTTHNAQTVTLSDGIGSVARDGSRRVSPDESTTYVLVASGPGGTVTCSDSITVDEDDEDRDRDVSCDAFTVSDRTVERGDRVTLEWRTTGANDVDINQGVGDVEEDGNERVTITRDTTFTLTARNGNDQDTCRVEVEVEEEEDDEDDADVPRCRLTISDTRVSAGKTVKLSWENLRTDRMILRDNHGKEIADSRDDRGVDEDSDSITVKPTRATEYTLTVFNGNRERTCTVGVTVGDISVTSVRAQDTITLSQVPYTGFEAGPVLTTIFYIALGLWGAAIAYVLVFKGKVAVLGSIVGAKVASGAPVVASAVLAQTMPLDLPTTHVQELPILGVDSADALKMLEQHAHASSALMSSDALRFIASQHGTYEEQVATLDRVITLAKTRFPKDGEWVVINKDRVITLLA